MLMWRVWPRNGSGIIIKSSDRSGSGEGLLLRIGNGDRRGSAVGLARVAKNEAEKMDGISMFGGADLSNKKMTKRKMTMKINLCLEIWQSR